MVGGEERVYLYEVGVGGSHPAVDDAVDLVEYFEGFLLLAVPHRPLEVVHVDLDGGGSRGLEVHLLVDLEVGESIFLFLGAQEQGEVHFDLLVEAIQFVVLGDGEFE